MSDEQGRIDGYGADQGPVGPTGPQGPPGDRGPDADQIWLPNPAYPGTQGVAGTPEPSLLPGGVTDWYKAMGASFDPPAGFGPPLSYRREGNYVRMRGAAKWDQNGVDLFTFRPGFRVFMNAFLSEPVWAALSVNSATGEIKPCHLFLNAGGGLSKNYGLTGFNIVVVGFEAVTFFAGPARVFPLTSRFPGLHEGYADLDRNTPARTPLALGYRPPSQLPHGEEFEGAGSL